MNNKLKATLITTAMVLCIGLLMLGLWVYPVIFPIVLGAILLFLSSAFIFSMYQIMLSILDKPKSLNKK
jgi:hypothetical protein